MADIIIRRVLIIGVGKSGDKYLPIYKKGVVVSGCPLYHGISLTQFLFLFSFFHIYILPLYALVFVHSLFFILFPMCTVLYCTVRPNMFTLFPSVNLPSYFFFAPSEIIGSGVLFFFFAFSWHAAKWERRGLPRYLSKMKGSSDPSNGSILLIYFNTENLPTTSSYTGVYIIV